MKKSLIIFTILIIIFFIYHKNVDGTNIIEKDTLVVEQEVFTSQNEMDRVEEVDKRKSKWLSVEIKGEREVFKETEVQLTANLKNTDVSQRYNYLWYEKNQLIYIGKTLEKSFEQGDHNITLVVKSSNGKDTNESMVLSAYSYYRIKKSYYDPYYGNLLFVERSVVNYKGNYLLYDDGRYMKEFFNYDENGNLIEKIVHYYNDVEEIIQRQEDINGDDTEENSCASSEKTINNSMDKVEEGGESERIVEYNENGQVEYEKYRYKDTVVKNKNIYEGKRLIKSINSSQSSHASRSVIMDYDEQGNTIEREIKDESNGKVCHYTTASTFTEEGMIKSDINTVLEGECRHVDEIKRAYIYDDEFNLVNIKVVVDGDNEAKFNTLSIQREYINEIER